MRSLTALILCLGASIAGAQLFPQKPGLLECTALRLGDRTYRLELRTDMAQDKIIADAFASHTSAQSQLSREMGKAKPEAYAGIQARMEALESATAKKVLSTLKPAQRQRLWELTVQEAGPFALRNAEVAKRVGVTPEQKAKIEAIAKRTAGESEELNAKMGTELEAAKSEKARAKIVKAYDPRMKKIEAQGEKEVLALLSKAQTANWKKANGAPFRL